MSKRQVIDTNMLRDAAAAISRSVSSEKALELENERVATEVKEKISSVPTVVCDGCGYYVFREVVLFKRFSKDQSPTGEEMLTPVTTYECAKCNHLNEEFLPSYVTSDIKKKDRAGLPTY